MSLKNFLKKAKNDTRTFWKETIKPEAKRLEKFWNKEVEPTAEKLWNNTKDLWRNITSSDDISTKEDCAVKNSIQAALDEIAQEPTAEPSAPIDPPKEEVTTSGDTGTDAEQ